MIQGDIRQIKLTTGEEIICEVLEWPDEEDEDDHDLVIRRPLKILSFEPTVGGARIYMFRPWMVMQTEPDQCQIVADYHIVGEGSPSPRMIEQYMIAIKMESVNQDSGGSSMDPSDIIEQLLGGDSDSNVIAFPGPRTLH